MEGLPAITEWFVSVASLSGVVVGLVALLRKHIIPGLEGFAVVIASVIVGAGLGVAGNLLNLIPGGFMAGVWFGIQAGLGASMGVDGVRALLGKNKPTPPDTGTLPG